jgi:hypothetical protein
MQLMTKSVVVQHVKSNISGTRSIPASCRPPPIEPNALSRCPHVDQSARRVRPLRVKSVKDWTKPPRRGCLQVGVVAVT